MRPNNLDDDKNLSLYKERLRKAEERFRIVCDSMPAGLLVLTLDGVIDFINRKTEKIFQLDSAEIIGNSLSVLIDEPLAQPFSVFVEEVKQRGGLVELEARKGTGESLVIELSLHDFDMADKPCLLATAMDITQRREVERLKHEIIAMVSHDLSSPLSSIQLSLNLLAAEATGPLSEQGMAMVQRAERSAAQLIKLINDLLSVEQLESGQIQLKPMPIHLYELLADSCRMVEDTAAANQIAINLKPTDAELIADADRLKQVVCNLLSNAIKFSPAASTIEVNGCADDDYVVVSVKDPGRGVPKQAQKRIFERFQQVQSSDGYEKGGRGLGLAICKAIIEQHGGQIGVTSEQGAGSTFWFRVPKTLPALKLGNKPT